MVTFFLLYLFIPILKRFFIRYTQTLGSRIILLFMGFWWISTETVSLSKSKREKTSWPAGGLIAKSGDIIICNKTSYVEILYLAFRFSPTFTVIPTDYEDSKFIPGKLIPRNLFQALYDCIYDPPYSIKQAIKLEDIISESRNYHNGPIVIFPEGTTTNGKTVQKFLPVFSGVDVKGLVSNIRVIGFKYEFEDHSPSFTVGSFFAHLFRLCCQFNNSMKVKYLQSEDIPNASDFNKAPISENGESENIKKKKSNNTISSTDKEEIGDWNEAICARLAAILRLRISKLTPKDKKEFSEFYYARQKGYHPGKKHI